jgi:hypothetical protein
MERGSAGGRAGQAEAPLPTLSLGSVSGEASLGSRRWRLGPGPRPQHGEVPWPPHAGPVLSCTVILVLLNTLYTASLARMQYQSKGEGQTPV